MAASKEDMNRLLNMARSQLPGVSEDALKATLWEVCFEFYENSQSWLEGIDFNVIPQNNNQAPVLDYAIVASEGRIVRLGSVIDSDGTPQPAFMQTPGVVHIINAPNQVQGTLVYTATVIKNVSLPTDKNSLPVMASNTLQLYPLVLTDGLIGKMMMQANRPYTDMKNGILRLGAFQQGWANARTDTMHANTIGAQAWSYPQQFSVNSQRGGVSVPGDRGFT